jgi:hypothetical protein
MQTPLQQGWGQYVFLMHGSRTEHQRSPSRQLTLVDGIQRVEGAVEGAHHCQGVGGQFHHCAIDVDGLEGWWEVGGSSKT